MPTDLGDRIEWARRTPVPADMPSRRIEWLGEKSPFEEPFVEFGVTTNQFTKEQVQVLRNAAMKTEPRWVGKERHLGINDQRIKLTRDYLWHRGNKWICRMVFADADAVLSSAHGHEFLDLDAHDQDAPKILYPPVAVRVVGEEVLKYGETVGRGRNIIQSLGPR
jgi:hypothetical protein